MNRPTALALFALSLFVTGCGAVDASSQAAETDDAVPGASDTAAMCLEGAADCDDTPEPGAHDGAGNAIDEGAILREAEGLLGESQDAVLEAFPDVRVGRRDGEDLALTEDYVIGRKTIATEDDGTGIHRVVEVTVELTDGVQVLPGA